VAVSLLDSLGSVSWLANIGPVGGGQTSTNNVLDYDPLYSISATDQNTGIHFQSTYDAVGNRLIEGAHASSTSQVYDIANRLTSVNGVTYIWDDQGYFLSNRATTCLCDHANRLVLMEQATVLFDFGHIGLGDPLHETVVYNDAIGLVGRSGVFSIRNPILGITPPQVVQVLSIHLAIIWTMAHLAIWIDPLTRSIHQLICLRSFPNLEVITSLLLAAPPLTRGQTSTVLTPIKAGNSGLRAPAAKSGLMKWEQMKSESGTRRLFP